MTSPNELKHARVYDPQKRHDYYMRTRKLKGRQKGSGGKTTTYSYTVAKPGKAKTVKQKRAEAKARVDALNKRLDKLRTVLAELVKQARSRSGVTSSISSNSTRSSKSSSSSKSSKPEHKTAAQKEKDAKRAKESREKTQKSSPSQEAKEVEAKIKEVRQQIAQMKKQIAEARKKASKTSKPKFKADSVGVSSTYKSK